MHYEVNIDEDSGPNEGVRISVVVDIEQNHETTHAHGTVHDTQGNLVAERTSRFSGFCSTEIVQDVVWAMLFGRRIDGKFFDAPYLEALPSGIGCDCHDQAGDPIDPEGD